MKNNLTIISFAIHKFVLSELLKKIGYILDNYSINFNLFMKKVNEKEYIYDLLKLTKILKHYGATELTYKKLNTAFLLINHSHIILPKQKSISSEKNVELKNNLLESARSLVYEIKNYDITNRCCILKLLNRVKRFVSDLDIWKQSDKLEVVKILTDMYYQVDGYITLIKKRKKLHINDLEELEIYKSKKEDVMKKIKDIDGMDIFKSIKPVIVEYDDNITSIVKNQMTNVYWDIFKKDLQDIPINKKMLINLLKELRNVIYNIFPKRIDLLKKLEINVNIDLIEKNNNFDSHYVLSCIDYYYTFLREIQSPAMDKKTDMMYKKFKKNLIEGDDFSDFLPDNLKYLMFSYYQVWQGKIDFVKNKMSNK